MKHVVHPQKSLNAAEIKQFCTQDQAKILHSDVKDSLPGITNDFFLNKWNQNLKPAFGVWVIFVSYLNLFEL